MDKSLKEDLLRFVENVQRISKSYYYELPHLGATTHNGAQRVNLRHIAELVTHSIYEITECE